jgi:RNA polymerase sigma factor (sigma-70 family)
MDNLPKLPLAEGIKTGDSNTILYVYKTLGPKIIGFVMNNSGTKEDGKELFQDAYLKAFQNLKADKYHEEGKFEQWFTQIARNLWLEELRQRRRSAAQNLDDVQPIADESSEDWERLLRKNQHLEALDSALNRIGDTCAYLLRRFHGAGISSKELAEESGKTDDALRKQLFDCRKKLKKYLNEELNNDDGQ